MRDRESFDTGPYLLSDLVRCAYVCSGHQDNKLFTTVTSGEIGITTSCATDHTGDRLKTPITFDMSVLIVVEFESVDIEKNNGDRALLSKSVFPPPFKGVIKESSVCEPRKDVGSGEDLKLLVRFCKFFCSHRDAVF